MDAISTVVVVIVSVLAGILGSLLGLGGGFIMVPVLAFMGIEPSRVAATSMFTVISTSASSTISYAIQKEKEGDKGKNRSKGCESGANDDNISDDHNRRGRVGRIDHIIALKLAIFALPGAVLGAYSSSLLDLSSFKLYFALLLTGVAVQMLINPYYHMKEKHYPMQISYAVSFFSGFIASLFGVGGGAVLVPMMLMVLRMKMHVTVPTVQLIILLSSISGVVTHAMLGHPEYSLAVMLIGGTFIGAQIGSRLLGKVKDILLRRLVAISLIGVAARLIYDTIRLI